jgi:hypothetical protein
MFQLTCRVKSALDTLIRAFLTKPSDNTQSLGISGMSFTLKMTEKFTPVNMTGSYVLDCTYTSATTTE